MQTLPAITTSFIPLLVLMGSPEPLHEPRPSALIGSIASRKSLNDFVVKEPMENQVIFISNAQAVHEDWIRSPSLCLCSLCSCIADGKL